MLPTETHVHVAYRDTCAMWHTYACRHQGGIDTRHTYTCRHQGRIDIRHTYTCRHQGGIDTRHTYTCRHQGGIDIRHTYTCRHRPTYTCRLLLTFGPPCFGYTCCLYVAQRARTGELAMPHRPGPIRPWYMRRQQWHVTACNGMRLQGATHALSVSRVRSISWMWCSGRWINIGRTQLDRRLDFPSGHIFAGSIHVFGRTSSLDRSMCLRLCASMCVRARGCTSACSCERVCVCVRARACACASVHVCVRAHM